ncbi:M23 family metallopeptidase [Microbacterium sp. NPDC076768]|uniref:M23 family metallopeptidase n=1 Tax=Microbacterium sp. NPDC076768 TaxID=3154858 RepID=UPI00343E60BC
MTPPILREPPGEPPAERGISRRGFMLGATVALSASAIGAELLQPASASAAVIWGYPFAQRSARSRGFTGQYPNGHAGIDYVPGHGTPIHAVASGTVIISDVSGTNGAYGESVWIQHADGYRSIYAHMIPGTRAPLGNVSRGDVIGQVGNTGNSYGSHLHIEIHRNGVALDPDPFINGAPLAGTNTPPEAPAPKDILMRTIYNINGVDSDEPHLRRRALVGEFTFQPLSLGAAQREFKLWGAPENVTQAEWDGFRALVNTRRTTTGLPPLT